MEAAELALRLQLTALESAAPHSYNSSHDFLRPIHTQRLHVGTHFGYMSCLSASKYLLPYCPWRRGNGRKSTNKSRFLDSLPWAYS